MASYIRSRLRDLFPERHQVPAKYWYGWARRTLEPEMALLEHIVRPGARVADVGGNRGVYAYHLWRLGCAVDVFEPNPACCRILRAWSHGKPRVQVREVALSSSSGEACLHIPVDAQGVEHDASASLEHGDFSRAREQVVPTATLDSFHYEDVALIKIDVEGHENSVLAGSTVTLAKAKPALLIEIEQRHNKDPIDETFGMLASLGYFGFFLDGGELRNIRTFVAARDQAVSNFGAPGSRYINNFLFLHRDAIDSGRYRPLPFPAP